MGWLKMNYTFSNKMNGVKASAVREILKAASDPRMISFGGGNPAKEAFPKKQYKKFQMIYLMKIQLVCFNMGLQKDMVH